MDDGRLHAALGQAVRRFKAEQTAADNNRIVVSSFFGPIGRLGHQVDVEQVAEGHNAVQIGTGQGETDRVRTHGQDQLVVGNRLAVVQDNVFQVLVDRLHPIAEVRLDSIGVVPVLRMGDDVVEALFPGQDWRQLDAVVGGAGLGADDRDFEHLIIALEDFLDDPSAGHAGPDDNDFFLAHDGPLRS